MNILLLLILSLIFAPAVADVDMQIRGGGVPTVTSCGTSPSVAGTDMAGKISVGTGVVTSCTLNFSAQLAVSPDCLMTPSSSAVALGITPTVDNVVISISATLGGGAIYYLCWIN